MAWTSDVDNFKAKRTETHVLVNDKVIREFANRLVIQMQSLIDEFMERQYKLDKLLTFNKLVESKDTLAIIKAGNELKNLLNDYHFGADKVLKLANGELENVTAEDYLGESEAPWNPTRRMDIDIQMYVQKRIPKCRLYDSTIEIKSAN